MTCPTDIAAPIVDQQGTTLLDLARMISDSGNHAGIELTDLKNSTANELRRFGEDLASHLTTYAQVHVPPAYQLRSTGEGKVEVIGEHPNKAAIESYLNNDTRLLKWFKELEVLFEIQHRIELTASGQHIDEQIFNLGMTSLGSIAFFTSAK